MAAGPTLRALAPPAARRALPAVEAARMPRRRRGGIRPSVGGWVGLALTAALVALALLGPALVTADPTHQALAARLRPPVWLGGSWQHPLGTDGLGRDLLARIVAGARLSLLVGVLGTLLAGGIGITLGAAAGYAGGAADRAVTFLADVQLALPFVVVAIAVAATLGQGLLNLLLVLGLTGWVGYARILRLQTRALRAAPFVEAARALGAGPGRILTRHLLPNLLGPIAVVATQQVAALILYEAALSYLGLGLPVGRITWGGLVAAGRDQLLTAWWVATLPGGAIGLTVLGLNLLGDWLASRR